MAARPAPARSAAARRSNLTATCPATPGSHGTARAHPLCPGQFFCLPRQDGRSPPGRRASPTLPPLPNSIKQREHHCRRMRIPLDELLFQATHASGPGGQGVNTSDSAAVLRWHLWGSRALSPEEKQRMAALCRRWMTREGWVVISASEWRSQQRNRLAARQRLEEMAERAAVAPKARQKTRVPPAQKRARREEKRRRSLALKHRRPDPTRHGQEGEGE